VDAHGTHVAGIAAGAFPDKLFDDQNLPFKYQRGVAYQGKHWLGRVENYIAATTLTAQNSTAYLSTPGSSCAAYCSSQVVVCKPALPVIGALVHSPVCLNHMLSVCHPLPYCRPDWNLQDSGDQRRGALCHSWWRATACSGIQKHISSKTHTWIRRKTTYYLLYHVPVQTSNMCTAVMPGSKNPTAAAAAAAVAAACCRTCRMMRPMR
jgi:hypothetical protein